jgi:hypothetical protein
MVLRSSVADSVIPIRVNFAIKLHTSLNHRMNHFSSVLEMHVVISGAMND